MNKKPFKPSQAAEVQFMRQLKKIGRHSGHLVTLHVDGHKIVNPVVMQKALERYSKLLGPWAAKQSAKMLTQVSKASKRAMQANAQKIGEGMRQVAELNEGYVARELMREQIELITSIPLKAAERAQKLAFEAVINGTRASEVAEMLKNSPGVSESDAATIARTEVARASSHLVQSRARAVGSTHYIWRNSGDASVREAHRKWHGKNLDGQIFAWDKPPTLDDGTTGNPGTFPNCRCYPEPVFTD